MACKLMSLQDFANHIKQIAVALYAVGEEFEVSKILEELYFTYKIKCGYSEVVDVLERLKSEQKLTCTVPGSKYKINPAQIS